MQKILPIDRCQDCKYYNISHDLGELITSCKKLKVNLDGNELNIPSWCPLDDYHDTPPRPETINIA